jgi:hypothetical protein
LRQRIEKPDENSQEMWFFAAAAMARFTRPTPPRDNMRDSVELAYTGFSPTRVPV